MEDHENGQNGNNPAESSEKREKPKATKKANSWDRSNIFSRIFFTWTIPIFRKGLNRDLNTADLRQPAEGDNSEPLADQLEKNWFREIEKCNASGKQPSLLRALIKTFLPTFIFDGFLQFIQAIFCKSFSPMVLGILISYFNPKSNMSQDMAYTYAAILIGLFILNLFAYHHSMFRTQRIGMRVRVACCSLVYRKLLRLNSTSLGTTTAGQLVNLISNDVSRFDAIFMYLHFLWIMPIQIVLVCYLIYTQVSVAALIGVASITLQTLPVQSYLSKLSSTFRNKVAKRTDERVRIMNEIISGIQVIKMYAWEKPFEAMVESRRAHEISALIKVSYLRGVYMSFMVFTERAALYITLLSYSLMGNEVSSSIVFSLAQFYNTLQATLAIMFPAVASQTGECWVTIKRLQKFLMMGERSDLEIVPVSVLTKNILNVKPPKDNNGIIATNGKQTFKAINDGGISNLAFSSEEDLRDEGDVKIAVDVNNVTASWTSDQSSIKDLSFKVPKGKLCAIIGSVGAGKSTILQLLLKELSPQTGSVDINGSLSYSSQEPWLFVATVRSNILFGLPYNHRRYKEVVRVCALEKDFQQFPRGDQTLVGERGVSLSGGQRARINLARAIYKQADIYLLDDPLSAVDAHVGRHLYKECISTYLKSKTVILVTHQLHYLHDADMIIILKNGRLQSVGSYDELVSSGEDFAQLLMALKETKTTETEEKNIDVIKLKRTVSQVSTQSNAVSEMDKDDPEELEGEEQLSGKITFKTYLQYWKSGGSSFFVIFMVCFMILGQISASIADYWVTFWTNQINSHHIYLNMTNSAQNTTTNTTWTDLYEKIGPFNTAEYLYIYTIIIALCIILILSRSFVFFKVCMNASKRLHDNMFHKISRGVMRFFDTNPSGRILNRFSKDIGAIDEFLPKAAMDAFQIFLVMLSILTLVSVTNVWMLIPVVIILVLFYKIFIMYLCTAQDIKRLEGITKSPVFSHMTSTLNGITTIRASSASQRLALEFDVLQDLHTASWYEYVSCCSTLGFWLDALCTIFLAIVSFTSIIFKSDDSLSGNIGLALSQSMILSGMLPHGVRQMGEYISQMTSVERVLQYDTIEEEKGLDKGKMKTPEKWPSEGVVVFENTYLKYSDVDPPVLKNLNIYIKNGWKVGIVGRTGAGKSSLISALFRLAKIEGNILIDDLETGSIALQDLRARISIIPQEPVLFSATIRYNLDPFNKFDDIALWNALEVVELKEVIPSLDFCVTEKGANFSLGQRQLICLARAILKNNQILVLDEATANVDPQTDAFIQKTIRIKFKQCTVLTIAHRLNTIMDSDRVLVMDTGNMAEFDHPHILLNNPEGHLYKMVQETGREMSSTLHKTARDAYVLTGGTPLDLRINEDIVENREDKDS